MICMWSCKDKVCIFSFLHSKVCYTFGPYKVGLGKSYTPVKGGSGSAPNVQKVYLKDAIKDCFWNTLCVWLQTSNSTNPISLWEVYTKTQKKKKSLIYHQSLELPEQVILECIYICLYLLKYQYPRNPEYVKQYNGVGDSRVPLV